MNEGLFSLLVDSLSLQGGRRMKKYKVIWKESLNETELAILLEEWKGFFEVEEE